MSVLPLLLLSAPIQTTWYVDDDGVAPGAGTSADPFTSVTFALARPGVVSGDTVLVRPGTYLDESVDFLGKDVVLRSTGGSSVTSLQPVPPQAPRAVVRLVSGETATIEGFEIVCGEGEFGTVVVPGVGDDVGGGLLCVDSDVVLRDVRFQGGGSAFGAGAAFSRASVEIDDCSFRDCGDGQGGQGAGLYAVLSDVILRDVFFEGCDNQDEGAGLCLRSCTSTLQRVVLRSNESVFGSGAGAYVRGGQASLFACTVEDNCSGSTGGGLAVVGGAQVTVDRSTIRRNQTGTDLYDGAGVAVELASLVMRSCVVEGNTGGRGGGLYGRGATILVEDSAFRSNASNGAGQFTTGGGAVYMDSPGGSVTLRRSIFTGNRLIGSPFSEGGGAVFGPCRVEGCTILRNLGFAGLGGGVEGGAVVENSIVRGNSQPQLGSATARYSNVEGGAAGPGNIDAEAEFWNGTADAHLLPDSPCIDAGDPSSPLDLDGTIADMGAFPFDPTYCVTLCTNGLGATTCTGNTNSTGGPATLDALGSALAGDDRLVLNVVGAPPGSVGIMLASRTDGNTPPGPGSQGALCLGGTILRFGPDLLDDRGTGVVSYRPRLASFPQGNVVLPGDSWSFQYWHRDANPGPTSNLSSVVRVGFM